MDSNQFENDIPSDALDAMADLAYEQRQAMMEEMQLLTTDLNHETSTDYTT
jgi:hypothetical protein